MPTRMKWGTNQNPQRPRSKPCVHVSKAHPCLSVRACNGDCVLTHHCSPHQRWRQGGMDHNRDFSSPCKAVASACRTCRPVLQRFHCCRPSVLVDGYGNALVNSVLSFQGEDGKGGGRRPQG